MEIQLRNKLPLFFLAGSLLTSIVTFCYFVLYAYHKKSGHINSGELKNVLLDYPVRLDPITFTSKRLDNLVSESDWNAILKKINPSSKYSKNKNLAYMLHQAENWWDKDQILEGNMRANGSELMGPLLALRADHTNQWSELLYRDHLGRPHVSESQESPSSETHACQFLSSCASLGLPSSQIIYSGRISATIGELLQTVREDFHFEGEVEWKIMALARYAPSRSSWTNRWGRTYDFDAAANHLLLEPYGEGSCSGTHVLQALAVLLRVDVQYPLFEDGTRDRIRNYIRGASRLLEKTQRPDGYWGPDWVTPLADPKSCSLDAYFFNTANLALVTGHHLEWICLVSDDISIDPAIRDKAISYCARTLVSATATEINAEICPYSHCFRAITRIKDRNK